MPEPIKGKRRGTKGWLWVGFALLVFLISALIAEQIIEDKLPKRLQSAISKESEGLYQIHFGYTKVNLWRGQFIAKNIHLIPDTARNGRLKKGGQTTLFELKAKYISIAGFKLLKLLWHKEINASDVIVSQPIIIQYKISSKTEKNGKNIRQQLRAIKNKIVIKKITLSGIQYRTIDMQSKKETWLKNINFHASNIKLGQWAKQQDSTRLGLVESFRFYGKKVIYLSNDELYKLQLARLDISTEKNTLGIDSFSVVPKYTEKQWSKTLKYKRDRYDMFFPKIEASGLDLKRWLNEGCLKMDSLVVNQAIIRVYADKGMREKKTMASNNFPSLAFQRLKVPITINNIYIRNTDVYYKELNPKSGRAGLVFFNNLNAHLQHVSNDSLQLKQNPWIKGSFSTFFLGKPKLTLNVDFNMLDTLGAFHYKGVLDGAPASFYNQLLEPITLARAEKGYVNSVRFNITANRYGANVETEMLYNDLKVAVLDASSGKLEKKGFLSLFINWLAIEANNPSKDGKPPRIARHYYKHPQEKTFFNLMWKALYSGLKVNLGLPEI